MAGDCPHSSHLEATLQHHHHHDAGDATTGAHLEASLQHRHHEAGGGPVILVDNHEKYLKIIDDLKNDLEQMSCEVVQVQQECCSQDKRMKTADDDDDDDVVKLTTSLKELELQNDRLEQALKQQTQAKEAAYNELETNNQALKCQIERLRQALAERDGHIMHLTTVLKHSSHKPQIESCRANTFEYSSGLPVPAPATNVCCSNNKRVEELERRVETLSTELDKSQRQEHFLQSETRKLNEELNDTKRKNGDLATQSQRLAGLLKSQESHRMELALKYDTLEKNYEDQAKKLREANVQLSVLNERYQYMERQQNEHNMERKLLRDEVMALKEKEAVVMGRQKSMHEQLAKTEKELYSAHDVMREQQTVIKSNDLAHAEELQRLKEENYDVKRKLKTLVEDYKRLQEAYQDEQEISKQSQTLLDTYRKWKEDQMKAESKTRDAFQQFEAYIQTLYKDKHELLNSYRMLRQDYSVLEAELDRLRKCSFNLSNYPLGQTLSDASIPERLEHILRTKNRVMEQCYALRMEEKTADQSQSQTTSNASKSTENPNEGPP